MTDSQSDYCSFKVPIDTNGVLADHTEDIVMFDVPPPDEGVRGIAAYRETWPPFFEWQAQVALIEIVSLDVTAGDEVAMPAPCCAAARAKRFTAQPGTRLRLTLGLRKEHGRWLVAHELHSFPNRDGETATVAEG
jgi:ketosteroid isomerase-like protein